MKTKRILILVGGGTKHLDPFKDAARKLKIKLTCASFSQLSYLGEKNNLELFVDGIAVNKFDLVYIRLVGRKSEECAVLVSYCVKNGIKVIDRAFRKSLSLRIPYPKAIEAKILMEKGINVPKTLFADLERIRTDAPKIFGYPFVIKGTTGKQGHAVWSPRNEEKLNRVFDEIKKAKEKDKEMKFIAQEFIKASQRNRVFIVGEKAIAEITRPTRWRRRFIDKVGEEFPQGERKAVFPIPMEDKKLAISAAKALYINIAGVDIITEDESGKKYVLEVNSAPRWESIKKDTGVNVEEEILKYLASLV